ncbi:MAG TPA: hypothetical protein VFC78_03940, partial [Tepidisphaeraceae bacterium]|nr:hypothetical protein [Tepidisphaeraceae bacterium]
GNRGLSRLECHAGSMTQTNGWRNADYCYCHAKQNPGRLWRDARDTTKVSRPLDVKILRHYTRPKITT